MLMEQYAEKVKNKVTKNEMRISFDAVSVNEGFARVAVSAFIMGLNPTLEEMNDIKTAVSEAVTNAIIHGYDNVFGYGKYGNLQPAYITIHPGKVEVRCKIVDQLLEIEVEDYGKGIEDISQAMEPMFTTRPEYNRAGLGFAFMEAFMDDLEVLSNPGVGTLVRMTKHLGPANFIGEEE